MNIPRYIDTFEEEELVDLKATGIEIEKLNKNIFEIESQMKNYLEELGF